MLFSHIVNFNSNGQYQKTDKNNIQCPQEQTTTSNSNSQVTITYGSGKTPNNLYPYNPTQVNDKKIIYKPNYLMQPDFFQTGFP